MGKNPEQGIYQELGENETEKRTAYEVFVGKLEYVDVQKEEGAGFGVSLKSVLSVL